jgi:ABC-type transporter Mla MlaB component
MLRITVHDTLRSLTFQLEGRLAGPWVRELEKCWKSTLPSQGKQILRVDLTGVTSVDDAGTACLAALHRQGAEFIASDCLTKDIVAEISETREVHEGRRIATSSSRATPPIRCPSAQEE